MIANGPAKKSSARVNQQSSCRVTFNPTLNHGETRGVRGMACGRYFFRRHWKQLNVCFICVLCIHYMSVRPRHEGSLTDASLPSQYDTFCQHEEGATARLLRECRS